MSKRRAIAMRDAPRHSLSGMRGAAARVLAGFLAVLFYVQLIGFSACAADMDAIGAAAGAAPICHPAGDQGDPSQGDRPKGPAHDRSCPYCVLHCHSPALTSAGIQVPERVAASLETRRALLVLRQAPAPIPAAAFPRGPPRLAA